MIGVHLTAIATAALTFGQTSNLTYLDTYVGATAPARVAPTGGGGIYVTDPASGQVVEFDALGAVAGTFDIPEGPVGIAAHTDGRFFVSRDDGQVGVYHPSTTVSLGTVDPSPMTLTAPGDMAFDGGAIPPELYVVDGAANRILVFEETAPDSWTLDRSWGMAGSGLGMLMSPQAIALDTTLGHVIVTDTDNFRGQVYDAVGTLLFKFGYRILYAPANQTAWFARGAGVAVDACSNIYLTDALMGTVRAFSPTGVELDPAHLPAIMYGAVPGQLRNPSDIAMDAAGTLFVANTSNAAVEVFSVDCSTGGGAAMPSSDDSFVDRKSRRNSHLRAQHKVQVPFPDNPADIGLAILNNEYSEAFDVNRDHAVDVADLELAVEHFGMGTVDDFLPGGVASHPYYEPPHIIDIPNRCGRCHSMDGAPGGDLDEAAGQENLCISCHSAGKIAGEMRIGTGDTGLNHPWGIPAADADPGPAPGSEVADHLENGNIRCGTCHEPHEFDVNVGYVRTVGDKLNLCGDCHKEAEEWTHAGHSDEHAEAFVHYDWSLPNRSACRRCHSGNGYIGLSEGLPAAEQDGSFRVVDCLVCHATHGKSQDGELLRIYDEVELPTVGPDVTITGVGTMATCMACHNGRRAPDDGSLTPHYMLGGVMLEGLNANDFGYTLSNSNHTTNPSVTCATCHMAAVPTMGPGAGKVGGHTFNVVDHDSGFENAANACAGCHTGLDTVNRDAGGDYDGDGFVLGVQDEVMGLMDSVLAALEAKGAISLGGYPYWDRSAVEPADASVVDQAIWNYEYVKNSGDYGVKNTGYAVGMLQVAYVALTDPTPPPAWAPRFAP
jgi:predicted CXXCH cytochrome family protein